MLLWNINVIVVRDFGQDFELVGCNDFSEFTVTADGQSEGLSLQVLWSNLPTTNLGNSKKFRR
jgi:hypothetical protein